MILTGHEIKQQLNKNIVIEPFDEKQLNSNGYDLRLHDELLVYEEIVLDMQRPNRLRRYTIPEEGFVLNPNQLYLGRTLERTETHNLVPMSPKPAVQFTKSPSRLTEDRPSIIGTRLCVSVRSRVRPRYSWFGFRTKPSSGIVYRLRFGRCMSSTISS